MRDVYITGVGKFLPGKPVLNDGVSGVIGSIGEKSDALGRATLRKNGIKQRYYSCQPDGSYTHTNAQMAALAIDDAVKSSKRSARDIDLIATSTTQGDLLVPGFASAVHAELGVHGVELASFQSVCASSLMAIKHVWLSVKSGETNFSIVSGSEFSSRWFRSDFYGEFYNESSRPEPEIEFLRWTLSDGAGAVAIENQPNPIGRSLRIDWIKQRSFADRYANCMYAGAKGNRGGELIPWGLYENPANAYMAGALVLRQDFDELYKMFSAWIGYYLELVDDGIIVPAKVDYFLPHYSANSLKERMVELLCKTGAMIDESRWFNNLAKCGNTGSASIFIMLEELFSGSKVKPGEQVLCFVPESGRGICAFMQLTVV